MANATVTFWISAFIPKTVKGYTQILSKGVHLGKTAVPLPAIARSWPGNWTKNWNAGYLTDQRGFSNSQSASHRMQSSAIVDLVTKRMLHSAHTTSGTTEVDLVSGVQTGFKNADMSRCSMTQRRRRSAVRLPLGRWRASASDPGRNHFSRSDATRPTRDRSGRAAPRGESG